MSCSMSVQYVESINFGEIVHYPPHDDRSWEFWTRDLIWTGTKGEGNGRVCLFARDPASLLTPEEKATEAEKARQTAPQQPQQPQQAPPPGAEAMAEEFIIP